MSYLQFFSKLKESSKGYLRRFVHMSMDKHMMTDRIFANANHPRGYTVDSSAVAVSDGKQLYGFGYLGNAALSSKCARLASEGLLTKSERVVTLPADETLPARVVTFIVYHLTPKGKEVWTRG